MRYFVIFDYDGGQYCGWQKQPNGETIQSVMEKAFETILRDEISLTGAGRTDAGVHAKNMVAHFDFDGDFDCEQLAKRLNSLLPKDIAIREIKHVDSEAHARFDAKKRKYEYHILRKKNPFYRDYSCAIYYPLDIEIMNKGAEKLIGRKDFQSFSKVHTDVNNYYCEIYKAFWEERDDQMIFTIEANRFLRGMVRAIVGTLVDLGAGRINLEDLDKIIDSHDRCSAGQAMDAKGLFFVGAKY
ncbi:MAG: tRNA pseudouridine(38-40) synthase TruA [Paludibacteraceae bacterium]|nr:tRNA pseudouridine(38-40) synthase TruA [Paludibacteraceae bacterium]